MDRGKRASMREGPLSALFRSTAELEEQKGDGRAEVDDLLTTLGDHPLSIALVAPHFKTLPPGAIRQATDSAPQACAAHVCPTRSSVAVKACGRLA